MKKLAVVVAVLFLAAACGSDGGDSSGDPEAALNAYADGINANSVDQTMAAFAEDAVMVEHPLNPGELNGKEEVRRGVSDTVSSSRVDPDAYSVSAVAVDGETVSWSYVWVNDVNQEFCAAGNEIDVNDDGLIVELRWGEDPGAEQCEAVKAAL
jgi:ketosteroid isomerase-like protein